MWDFVVHLVQNPSFWGSIGSGGAAVYGGWKAHRVHQTEKALKASTDTVEQNKEDIQTVNSRMDGLLILLNETQEDRAFYKNRLSEVQAELDTLEAENEAEHKENQAEKIKNQAEIGRLNLEVERLTRRIVELEKLLGDKEAENARLKTKRRKKPGLDEEGAYSND